MPAAPGAGANAADATRSQDGAPRFLPSVSDWTQTANGLQWTILGGHFYKLVVAAVRRNSPQFAANASHAFGVQPPGSADGCGIQVLQLKQQQQRNQLKQPSFDILQHNPTCRAAQLHD